jgi:hypothetical protein
MQIWAAWQSYLHPCIIHIESKVPIADLKRSGFIIDQACSDNVELGHNPLSCTR